ncbi:MAG TPA: NUDIX hydrolase N-terminal domain-containing protein [Solirubrobacteraceae bacterium]|jgi:8-oxo-dGTP pyrophosphatase MutT (NUDIX family)|nr:NUDIX hydrolase N-terminal domain-containing protein [Solirubrobacteraceae bacterium]
MERQPPEWLRWVRTLQSASQAGLTYSESPFERDRYRAVANVAAEMAAAVSGLPTTAVAEAFAADSGHPTPKVDVRGAVFRDERVLLVRERVDAGWTLPGGWADPGDPPGATVAREVREESGYQVRPIRLVAVHDRDLHNYPPIAYAVYKLFFLCELLTPEPVSAPDHEIDDVDWFDPYRPPPLSTGRVTSEQLALVARYRADPDRPAEFD